MQRETVDFHYIRFADEKIHERCLNWARYVRTNRGGYAILPMFRLYAPYGQTAQTKGAVIPIDTLDGHTIEAIVRILPEPQRGAIRWWYVGANSGIHLHKMLRLTKLNPAQLCAAVHEGRAEIRSKLRC